MNKFDEEEENKLEYTGIYESYVQIVDHLIDSKLAEECGFAQPDIEAFYVDFAGQSAVYESIDSEAFATLMEFTDFVQFREIMLAQKKVLNQDSGAMGTQATLTDFSDYDDYYWKISKEDLNDPVNGWRVRMDLPPQNNMEGKVYSKKVDGFPVEWIHSDVIYKGVSMDIWLKTVSDMERMFKGHD